MKRIAIDIKAIESNQKHPADINQTGSWQLVGTLTLEKAEHLITENGSAIHSAIATFSYIRGSTPSPTGPVPLPPILAPPLQLKAQTTKLMSGGRSVLVEGDQAQDSFGNKLEVSQTSNRVKTD